MTRLNSNNQPPGIRVVLVRKASTDEHADNRDIDDLDAYATNIIRAVGVDRREPLAQRRAK